MRPIVWSRKLVIIAVPVMGSVTLSTRRARVPIPMTSGSLEKRPTSCGANANEKTPMRATATNAVPTEKR